MENNWKNGKRTTGRLKKKGGGGVGRKGGGWGMDRKRALKHSFPKKKKKMLSWNIWYPISTGKRISDTLFIWLTYIISALGF